MHRGSLRADDGAAPQARRAWLSRATPSFARRASNSARCTRVGRERGRWPQVRTIDEGPVRTQDTKSRGHQNQSGTILVWPSNCLNEPDHLSVMMVLVTVQSVGEDPGRLFMERTVLFDIDRVRKLSDPQRWGADRSVACRHTRSVPARTARDRRPFSVNPVLTSRKLSRGFEDPRWTGMAAVRAEAEGDDVERRIDERRWRAGGRRR